MERYYLAYIIKTFKEKEISFFSLSDFYRLFNLKNKNTLYKKIQRLEKTGLIKKLIKGKYYFSLNTFDDFALANFLYQPSYISLETALSFYGIITGFSYRITSVTPKKPLVIKTLNKDFQYSHLSPSLFWGYEKKEDFLIAEPEKALLDYLYFSTKGLRTFNRDEFNLKEINKKKLLDYCKKVDNKSLLSIIKKKLL